MAKKTPPPNRWLEQHEYLKKHSLQNAPMNKVCELCRWSRETFYRNIKNTENISISDKLTIANVYTMPVHFLFPEMEFENSYQ